ncbi:MAG: MoaD/ThiS family protein [Mycobacteriaceae bacterium]
MTAAEDAARDGARDAARAGPTVLVRYFAAAAAAARTTEETVALPVGATVQTLVGQLGDHRAELAPVLQRCSFLHDAVAVRDLADRLQTGAVVDVLPPFAGG